MDLGIKGKYALITGGSHGIGRAIALALADEGCNVAICARNKDRIEQTIEDIKNREEDIKNRDVDCIGISADVLIPEDIDLVVNTVINKWKKIDILVNNIGGGGRWGSENILETKEQVWLDVYNKNALATIRFTMKLIPYMIQYKWGRVVTISSIYGKESGGRPWFNMAKSAEISLMKTLSTNQEFVRNGITFNSVAPGAIMIPDTDWEKEQNGPKFKDMLDKEFPLGRLGTPEEVANLVVFICSEKSGIINGACITADGGQSRSF